MFLLFQPHPITYNTKRCICQQDIDFVTSDVTKTFLRIRLIRFRNESKFPLQGSQAIFTKVTAKMPFYSQNG